MKKETVSIILPDESRVLVDRGISLLEVEKMFFSDHPYKIMAFSLNYVLEDLNYKLVEPVNRIRPIDLDSNDGVRIYQRSLVFVLTRAVRDCFPHAITKVEHSLSDGLFCEIEKDKPLTLKEVKMVRNRMEELIELDEDFTMKTISKEEAIKIYLEQGMQDKVDLLNYRDEKKVMVYEYGDMTNYFYGYMLPSAGKLDVFDLEFYDGGFILRHPTPYSSGGLPPFERQDNIAAVHREAEEWGEILGVEYVHNINRKIKTDKIKTQILTTEALHEKKIIEIADKIYERKSRVILIAGPSCSGKTTFANRLRIHLSVLGLVPVTVSMDDYFVNREDTPRDEDGNYDFESIKAIDVAKFSEDIKMLIDGEKVRLPRFNFETGHREDSGIDMKLSSDQPIIIEGIHGLNPALTEYIEDGYIFKVYVSCLTQLNVDDHNRIPTTDSRLIRRIVRDSRTRGRDASTTIKGWTSVRNGEEKYIFPFQETADAEFNSATVYELSALKPYLEEELKSVAKSSDEVPEAHRLLSFLSYVEPLKTEKYIPNTAIIREFIGGNVFHE